ncbi:hypothetical protein PGB90_009609 [Kerria lacca]
MEKFLQRYPSGRRFSWTAQNEAGTKLNVREVCPELVKVSSFCRNGSMIAIMMMVNLCWKFYGIIFTIMLIFCTHDVWTEKIWPEIRVANTDVSPYQENVSNNPSTFFALLTTIGCAISGIWLLYVMTMAIFLTPGAYIHLLPQTIKITVKQYMEHLSSILPSDDDEFEEFMPKLQEKKLAKIYADVFQLHNENDNQFSLTDDDSITELMPMPSFDDSSIDSSSNFAADFKNKVDISDSSSTSSDLSDSMKFQGAHFNNVTDEFDTSEEDNEKDFVSHQPDKHEAADSLLGNIIARIGVSDIHQLGRSIMNSISSTSTSVTHPPRKQYSTDEEFEIINESDVN